MKRYQFSAERERAIRARNRLESRLARKLGVTAKGLEVLGMAVANGGKLKRTNGTAAVKLDAQGYIIRHPNADVGMYGGHVITNAGREIVRRAREMGW